MWCVVRVTHCARGGLVQGEQARRSVTSENWRLSVQGQWQWVWVKVCIDAPHLLTFPELVICFVVFHCKFWRRCWFLFDLCYLRFAVRVVVPSQKVWFALILFWCLNLLLAIDLLILTTKILIPLVPQLYTSFLPPFPIYPVPPQIVV